MQVKNDMWLSRYRTVDRYNVYGGRSTIGYESGKGGPKVDNRAVMWPEMAERDVMTENREKRVWALAKGGDLKVDDSNAARRSRRSARTSPARIPTARTRSSSGEEAIKHMTVPKG